MTFPGRLGGHANKQKMVGGAGKIGKHIPQEPRPLHSKIEKNDQKMIGRAGPSMLLKSDLTSHSHLLLLQPLPPPTLFENSLSKQPMRSRQRVSRMSCRISQSKFTWKRIPSSGCLEEPRTKPFVPDEQAFNPPEKRPGERHRTRLRALAPFVPRPRGKEGLLLVTQLDVHDVHESIDSKRI